MTLLKGLRLGSFEITIVNCADMLALINVAGGVWVDDGADNVDMVVVGGAKVARKGGRWRGAKASAVGHRQGRASRVSEKWLQDCSAKWECLPVTPYLV